MAGLNSCSSWKDEEVFRPNLSVYKYSRLNGSNSRCVGTLNKKCENYNDDSSSNLEDKIDHFNEKIREIYFQSPELGHSAEEDLWPETSIHKSSQIYSLDDSLCSNEEEIVKYLIESEKRAIELKGVKFRDLFQEDFLSDTIIEESNSISFKNASFFTSIEGDLWPEITIHKSSQIHSLDDSLSNEEEEIVKCLTESEKRAIKLKGIKFRDLVQEDFLSDTIIEEPNSPFYMNGSSSSNKQNRVRFPVGLIELNDPKEKHVQEEGPSCRAPNKHELSRISHKAHFKRDFSSSDEDVDIIRLKSKITEPGEKYKSLQGKERHDNSLRSFNTQNPEKDEKVDRDKLRTSLSDESKWKKTTSGVPFDQSSRSDSSTTKSIEISDNLQQYQEKSKRLEDTINKSLIEEVEKEELEQNRERELYKLRQTVALTIEQLYTIYRHRKLREDPTSAINDDMKWLQNDMAEKINHLIFLNKKELHFAFVLTLYQIDKQTKYDQIHSQVSAGHYISNILVYSCHGIEYSNFNLKHNPDSLQQSSCFNDKPEYQANLLNNDLKLYEDFNQNIPLQEDGYQGEENREYMKSNKIKNKKGTHHLIKKLYSFLHRLNKDKPDLRKIITKERKQTLKNLSKNSLAFLIQGMLEDDRMNELDQKNTVFYHKLQEIRNIIIRAGIKIDAIKKYKSTNEFDFITKEQHDEYILSKMLIRLGLKVIPQGALQKIEEYHAPFIVWIIDSSQDQESTAYLCSEEGRNHLRKTLEMVDRLLEKKNMNLGAKQRYLTDILSKLQDIYLIEKDNCQALGSYCQCSEGSISMESTQSTSSPEIDNMSAISPKVWSPKPKLSRKERSEMLEPFDIDCFFSKNNEEEDFEKNNRKKVKMDHFYDLDNSNEEMLRFLKDKDERHFLK